MIKPYLQVKNEKKTNVLFIESGESDGGSFESLYQHLLVINREKYAPVIVYLNKTRFEKRVKQLDFPVYILNSLIYSKHIPRVIRATFLSLLVLSEKYRPSAYLFFSRLVHRHLIGSLQKIVTKHNIQIIHLNDQTKRDLFGIHLAEKAEVFCLSHLRSTRSGLFDKCIAFYTNSIVDIYIANGMVTHNYWVEKGLDISKIRLIYNGISTKPIDALDIRSCWEIDNDIAFVVACASPLLEEKGQLFLIRAFYKLVQKCPHSLLIIMGDGKLKAKYLEETALLKIEDKVIFTGFEKRVKEILTSVDVVVVPSVYDSFGRIVLETMHARTPLIATDVGGIHEIVENEKNALLVKYGDEIALANAMERLMNDKSLRKKLIENGYRTVRDKFSIEKYASQMEEIYDSVLKPPLNP